MWVFLAILKLPFQRVFLPLDRHQQLVTLLASFAIIRPIVGIDSWSHGPQVLPLLGEKFGKLWLTNHFILHISTFDNRWLTLSKQWIL